MEWYEVAIVLISALFGGYLVIWAIPGTVMSAMVALGDVERIVFIDKQLAKNLKKYYDERGYLKPEYQLYTSIGTRLFGYWIAYPFIKKRATTQSKKFRLFMWINCLGMWSLVGTTFFVCLAKLLGIIP
ncbi:hypothetical protein A1OK_12785 [Enterovibrio norvegicus FF-454]|uniref:Uncharacterized protein n=1 Tax=Enterovibrio norvegicus FF-454 TaxID=1185651 RepID=A0A1E5C369_9GAMM|nr:hypothetical protein [Enterovibrio norvegicus]OEE59959.1 hypothetical protein A1OK_12785 [Enterovibrio norvegicus FF-454]